MTGTLVFGFALLLGGGSVWGIRAPIAVDSAELEVSPGTPSPSGGRATTPNLTPSPVVSATPRPTPTETPAPTPSTQTLGIYGSGVGADTLANTQIGGSNHSADSRTSLRFRAERSGSLVSIGIYLEDGQGYAGGDGGTLQVTIHEDDGSEDHLPTGHPLASMRFEPGNPIDLRLGERMFDKPAELSAGRIYHAVFENVSRSPGRDFVSINALLVEDPGPGSAGPDLTEEGWALLLDDGSGWDVRRGYLPILQLRYGDGTVDGMAYIEVWAANAPTITATTPVRQVFTVSGPSRVVAALNLRATHVVGSGPLLVRIEGIDGRVSESYATLPTAGTALDWRRASFDPPLTLESGSSYHVLLVAPPGTEYAATALRKGAFYGFEAPAYFGDGHAEYWAGDTWRGYDQPGGRSDTTEGDLQFYFE